MYTRLDEQFKKGEMLENLSDFNFQQQSFETLLDTFEQLSAGGYCNTDDEESRKARLLFKNSVHMLKYVMFNLTQPSKS